MAACRSRNGQFCLTHSAQTITIPDLRALLGLIRVTRLLLFALRNQQLVMVHRHQLHAHVAHVNEAAFQMQPQLQVREIGDEKF